MEEPKKTRFTRLRTINGTEIIAFLLTAEEAAKIHNIDYALTRLGVTPIPFVIAAPSSAPKSGSQYKFFCPVRL